MTGLLGIVLVVLDIIAVMDCWKTLKDNGKKILWTILIVVFPLLGLILYYLVVKKQA